MTHNKEATTDDLQKRENEISVKMENLLPDKEGMVMSTVSVRPDVKFDTQNIGEEIFLLVRRSHITNIWWILRAGFMVVLPVIVVSVFASNDVNLFKVLTNQVMIILLYGWYLLTFSFIVIESLRWFYNVLIITNERFIDIDYNPVLFRRISEAALENIEDVTDHTPNFISTIFNYGNIDIQTAAEKREFEFQSAPRPSWLRDKIMDLATLRKNLLGLNK